MNNEQSDCTRRGASSDSPSVRTLSFRLSISNMHTSQICPRAIAATTPQQKKTRLRDILQAALDLSNETDEDVVDPQPTPSDSPYQKLQ